MKLFFSAIAVTLLCTANMFAQDVAPKVAQSQPASPATVATPTTTPAPPKAQEELKEFDLTFDSLKFEMEKGSDFDRTMLTEAINSYHGNIVEVRGFIRPTITDSGLTKFIFVRDNKECCFGPGAAIYDCILVRLKKGLETDYTIRPVAIKGKFALKEYKGPDGKVWSIYRMTDAVVQ